MHTSRLKGSISMMSRCPLGVPPSCWTRGGREYYRARREYMTTAPHARAKPPCSPSTQYPPQQQCTPAGHGQLTAISMSRVEMQHTVACSSGKDSRVLVDGVAGGCGRGPLPSVECAAKCLPKHIPPYATTHQREHASPNHACYTIHKRAAATHATHWRGLRWRTDTRIDSLK